MPDPTLIGALVIAGAIGAYAWMRRARAQRVKFNLGLGPIYGQRGDGAPEAARPSQSLTLATPRLRAEGYLPILIAGRAGGLIGPTLQAFDDSDIARVIGPIQVIEPDSWRREWSTAQIPARFTSRVVAPAVRQFPVGVAGETISRLDSFKDRWQNDIELGSDEWLTRVQRDGDPGLLLSIMGSDASALLAKYSIENFAARYPHLPIYNAITLAEPAVLRRHISDIRRLYGTGDLVRGFIVVDHRDPGALLALTLLFAATTAPSWGPSATPFGIWEALGQVFPSDAAGRCATVKLAIDNLPVYCGDDGDATPTFITKPPLLEGKVIQMVKGLVENGLHPGALGPASKEQSRVICVICPVKPGDFRPVAERAERILGPWRAATDPNLTVVYASLPTRMTASTREVPIVAVLLQPLADGLEEVERLALAGPLGWSSLDGPMTLGKGGS